MHTAIQLTPLLIKIYKKTSLQAECDQSINSGTVNPKIQLPAEWIIQGKVHRQIIQSKRWIWQWNTTPKSGTGKAKTKAVLKWSRIPGHRQTQKVRKGQVWSREISPECNAGKSRVSTNNLARNDPKPRLKSPRTHVCCCSLALLPWRHGWIEVLSLGSCTGDGVKQFNAWRD